MPHVRSQSGYEWSVGILPQGQRIRRRRAPVLSCEVESIRRSANAGTGYVGIGVGPGIGAIGTHADGEVQIETTRTVSRIRSCGSACQLAICDPLRPGMIVDAMRVFLREPRNSG